MIALRLMLPLVALALLAPTDLLDLAGAPLGAGVPPGWTVRAVRGQKAPDAEVRRDADERVFRIHGAGRAAWFYHELSAPAEADLREESRDDSPMRVFVVFGKQGFFRNSARIIFYTFGNAEPSGLDRPSTVSDKLHVIRVDGAAQRGAWQEHAVNPFADYRRIWGKTPPAVTAVGVMQDTDQTRAEASAELRRLAWVPAP